VPAGVCRDLPIEPTMQARYAVSGRRRHHMIRFLFRFIGFLILAGGFIALVIDGTKSIAGNAIYVTKLSVFWNNLHSTSLPAFQDYVLRTAGEWAWNPIITTVLEQPAWLVFGIVGAVLMLIGRKKKPLIGYVRE
jgi:hypothetical protein